MTYPYTDATEPRAQCDECGKWERGTGLIRHSKSCDSKQQLALPAVASPVAAAPTSLAEIDSYARGVRRSALTHGRDADTLRAVRAGALSVNDAMNTDD